MHRTLLGMNQTTVGEAIGLTFQQVQKYENGTNRISASQLYDLARLLDVPIQHFFDDMPTAVAASSPARGGGKAKKPPNYETDPMATRETLELVHAYYKIADPQIRKRLFEVVKALGTALATLGEREAGTARLEAAVTASACAPVPLLLSFCHLIAPSASG